MKMTRVFPRIGGRVTAAMGVCAMLVVIGMPQLARGDDLATQADAFRLLEQATFGPTAADIAHVQSVGPAAYLNEQFGLAPPPIFDLGFWPDDPVAACDGPCQRDEYSMYMLQVRFFANAISGEDPYTGVPRQDQLRQRVAFALNQIMVISAQDPTLRLASRMEPYLAVFDNNAFGNFRDLLYLITVNPGMGRYLDMVTNTKNAPNENYAREILQLFSIGLDKLNPDGTPILDPDTGNRIPTYSQETVTNFARVFTGWTFQVGPAGVTNYHDPMRVNENNHDTMPKTLLDHGDPSCSIGMNVAALPELNSALDCIMSSPSVAPYISKNLIQHLVTSNPSPDYVSRVTNAFTSGNFQDPVSGQTFSGGTGRGDMKAVIAAILLDPEARGDVAPTQNYGHLREPVLWITNLLRNFNTNSSTSDFALSVAGSPTSEIPLDIRTDQEVFRSPTVFNFFPPGYVVPGESVLGPEFAIQSTATVLGRINFAYELVFHQMPTNTRDRPIGTWIDENTLLSLPTDPQMLVATLNTQMMHGSMTSDMNTRLVSAVTAVTDPDPPTQALKRAREAVYLIATSSQYNVER